MNDEALIEEYLKVHGVQKCAPHAARVLGEDRPGLWRDAERRAEKEKKGGRRMIALQRRLSSRGR